MEQLNRRQTLLNIAVASVVLPNGSAAAQSSGSPEGREVAPGVRRVEYSKRETMIPNYKTVLMRDNIYQPGASVLSLTGDSEIRSDVRSCSDGQDRTH
jgi:hypothetical protein